MTKQDPPISLRLTKQDWKNIKILIKRWGENRSQVIKRSLEQAVKKGE